MPPRVSELDSVRGLAAFVVVLHHCWETILPDQNIYPLMGRSAAGTGWLADIAFWISVTPLRLLFCGHAAVAVFFVLSGFVLTKSLANPRQSRYSQFLIRRICRIYPPFAAVILAAAGLCYWLQPVPIPGLDWIDLSWSVPVSWRLVFGHLSMIVTSGVYTTLDSPMWTLVHEMRISIIFPLLAAITIARPKAALTASLALFAVFSVRHLTTVLSSLPADAFAREVFASVIETMRYVLFFVLGILIASQYPAFESRLRRHAWLPGVLWPLAIVLLALPYTKAYTEIAYATGAFLTITLSLFSEGAKTLLRHSALRWLGKVSYSLYLSHLVVLLALVHWLHTAMPLWAILALFVPLSLLVAQILYRLVEMPSHELGKHLANRLA
jgi:peptidoglycan/LPS O-acetylase OafA/YrhL